LYSAKKANFCAACPACLFCRCTRGFVYVDLDDVSIVARLRAGRSRVLVTTDPGDLSLFINAKTGFGAHPARYSVNS